MSSLDSNGKLQMPRTSRNNLDSQIAGAQIIIIVVLITFVSMKMIGSHARRTLALVQWRMHIVEIKILRGASIYVHQLSPSHKCRCLIAPTDSCPTEYISNE